MSVVITTTRTRLVSPARLHGGRACKPGCRTWPCFSQCCGQPYTGSPEGTVAELEAVVARLQVDITTQQSLMIAVRDKANDLDEKS